MNDVWLRLLLLFSICLGSCGSAFGLQANFNLTAAEQAYLDSQGPVVFVSQANYPPFEFRQSNGVQDGMTIELAHWLATEIGFRAKFVATTFLEAQQAVLNGDADVLTSLFYSEKRDRSFDFTQPIFDVPAAIFVPVDRPDIVRLQDLTGKRIAIQRGDYAKDFLESRGIAFEMIPTGDFAEATEAVIAGRADAVVGDEQIVLYYLFSQGLTSKIKKVGEPLYTGLDCMAVKDGNQLLQSILNKGITHARSTGVFEKLSRKWVGTAYPVSRDYWAMSWPWLVAIGVLVLLVGAWNLHLSRAVARKTRDLAESENRYRQMCEQLRVREQRLEYALEGANDGLWDWNLQSGASYFSPRWQTLLGYQPGEIAQRYESWENLLHPEDRAEAVRGAQRLLEHPDENLFMVFRMRGKDGAWRWILSRGKVMEKDAAGRPLRAVGTHQDITLQKQTEEALRESEERFSRMFREHGAVMALIAPETGEIIDANRAACDFYGYSVEQFKKLRIDQINMLSGEEIARTIEQASKGEINQFEFPHRLADGEIRTVEVHSSPISVKGRTLLFSIIQDMTERKRLEREKEQAIEQLFHAQKLESLGRLAGGIAHDLNNLLVPVIVCPELIMKKLPAGDHPALPLLQQIQTAGQRASGLVNQILAFARRQRLEMRSVDPNQIVSGLEPLVKPLLGSGIELVLELADPLPAILADSGKLEQALVNLAINAREAMPSGGTLRISTGSRRIPAAAGEELGIALPPGDYVRIAVADTGQGIDPGVRDQILEPFFSTRPNGTGLGLSTVLGIVEQHGGALEIASELGAGSVFSLWFPVAGAAADRPAEVPAALHSCWSGQETILIVDDDAAVRLSAGEILRGAGYHLLEASNGEQAQRIVQNPPDPLDLILTDLTMPQMSGYQLAENLRALAPGTPVVFMSGYAEPELQEQGGAIRGGAFIRKPFQPQEMLEFIRRSLDDSERARRR
jgi:PAS domain S-box-containing protein